MQIVCGPKAKHIQNLPRFRLAKKSRACCEESRNGEPFKTWGKAALSQDIGCNAKGPTSPDLQNTGPPAGTLLDIASARARTCRQPNLPTASPSYSGSVLRWAEDRRGRPAVCSSLLGSGLVPEECDGLWTGTDEYDACGLHSTVGATALAQEAFKSSECDAPHRLQRTLHSH